MRFLILLVIISLPLAARSQQVYDFQLETPEGKLVKYAEVKGSSLTVIDFWATWCKPCVNSIPKLVELASSYKPEEVSFLAISIDSPRNLSKIRPFAESAGITYPVLLDTDQEVMKEFNIMVIPTLILVNRDNEIVMVHEGFSPGDELMLKGEIDKLMHE